MNVWTDRETDRQNSHTLRICGARSGSPQIPSESGTCDKQNVIWNKVDRSHKMCFAVCYICTSLPYHEALNYTYPHSSIQLKLSALLLMYKCWYIPCYEMDGLLCHLCLFWQAVLLLRWCVFIILPTSAMYNDQKLVEVV